MSGKIKPTAFTEDELEALKKGVVPPTVRQKLGVEITPVKITTVYEFSIEASEPLWIYTDNGRNEKAIGSVEELDDAFENEKEWVVGAIQDFMGNNDPTSITVTYDGKTVEIEP